MRTLLLIILLLVGSAAEADITSNLIYHYRFDNDLTEEVAGNTGTNETGTATFTASGLPFSGPATTHSLVLGASTRVRSTSNATGLTGAYSYAFWVKYNSFVNVWSHLAGTGGQVFARCESNVIKMDAGTGDADLLGTTNINDSAWHHVVFTFDGTNSGGLTIYVDGSSDATGTGTTAVNVPNGLLSFPQTNSESSTTNLDDFRVYSRELSSGDVTELYNYTGASAGSPLLRVLLESQ